MSGGIEEEVQALKALLPQKVETREERKARNTKLRKVLSAASKEAIVRVFYLHPLCAAEGEKRLTSGTAFNLGDLCEIASPLGMTGVHGRGEKKLYGLLCEVLTKVVPATTIADIADVVEKYKDTILDTGTEFVDQIRRYANLPQES